jgi:ABC-2 type transport system permease protein
MNRQLNAIFTIAYRDFVKFLRDRSRIIATFIFPFIFIAVLGGSLQSNLGKQLGYDFLLFTFIGVLAQTLFQSTAAGIISLVEDRENDFSQEMFVSPISRYSIILGKILGESLVSITQVIGIVFMGIVIGVHFDPQSLFALAPFVLVICAFGGAFGVLVLANLSSQRAANQVFPFLILPQFFLAGIFNPIKELPFYLLILSRIAPLTYAVDFMRAVYYWGKPEYSKVVLFNPVLDFAVMTGMFVVFLLLGTFLFVRNERNR